jgi:hypothetical protein
VGWCGFGRSSDAWPGGWFLAWVVPGVHLPIFDLTTQHASLEEAFMKLTDDSVDFRSHEVREAVTANQYHTCPTPPDSKAGTP